MRKIEFENITDEISINGNKYYLVKVDQVEKLLDDNQVMKVKIKEYEHDLTELKNAITGILSVLGILDPETNAIKSSIQSGEESYMKHMAKAMTNIVLLMTTGQTKKLEEKFHFIKSVLPVVNKYANGPK